MAHKCCKQVGIRSKARKYVYKKEGEEHIQFPNIVDGNWNATAPVQIVVSDMTVFKNKGKNWEWTLLLDTFNNEILAHQATPITGSSLPYYPDQYADYINRLSAYMESNGKYYASHYATIRKWLDEDNKPKLGRNYDSEYAYDKGDCL